MYYKLVASDIDGTLLDSGASILPSTAEAVSEFRARGGYFMLATGRSEHSSREYADKLGLDGLIITFNGAKVVDLTTGEVAYDAFLEPEKAALAFFAIRALGKDVIVYRDALPYAAAGTPVTKKYGARIKADVEIAADMRKYIDEKTRKLLIIDPEREFDRALEVLRPIYGDELNTVNSDAEYLEVLPKGCSKGGALLTAAALLGMPVERTVAVGDHHNDVPMIKAAGLGVAVANAAKPALLAADYITGSNDEDGLGDLLRRIVAGQSKFV